MDMSSSPRVLFVDDEISVRQMYTKMAQRMGYFVDTAVDGLDAIELVRRRFYPVIVTDLRMPGLGGMQLLELSIYNHSTNDIVAV